MNNVFSLRNRLGMSQDAFAEYCNISRISIARYEAGGNVGRANAEKIASACEVSISYVLGDDTLTSILPIRPRVVPILGNIACGTPITAEQNIEGYADLPDGVHADFALRCMGDSMEPSFLDGDLVLIRQAGDVADGKIAAVMLNGETSSEATLKRIHHISGGLILIPDNQNKYGPLTYHGKEAENVKILGVAVGYVRMI